VPPAAGGVEGKVSDMAPPEMVHLLSVRVGPHPHSLYALRATAPKGEWGSLI